MGTSPLTPSTKVFKAIEMKLMAITIALLLLAGTEAKRPSRPKPKPRPVLVPRCCEFMTVKNRNYSKVVIGEFPESKCYYTKDGKLDSVYSFAPGREDRCFDEDPSIVHASIVPADQVSATLTVGGVQGSAFTDSNLHIQYGNVVGWEICNSTSTGGGIQGIKMYYGPTTDNPGYFAGPLYGTCTGSPNFKEKLASGQFVSGIKGYTAMVKNKNVVGRIQITTIIPTQSGDYLTHIFPKDGEYYGTEWGGSLMALQNCILNYITGRHSAVVDQLNFMFSCQSAPGETTCEKICNDAYDVCKLIEPEPECLVVKDACLLLC